MFDVFVQKYKTPINIIIIIVIIFAIYRIFFSKADINKNITKLNERVNSLEYQVTVLQNKEAAHINIHPLGPPVPEQQYLY